METACHMLLNKFGNIFRILAYALKKTNTMIVLLIDLYLFPTRLEHTFYWEYLIWNED